MRKGADMHSEKWLEQFHSGSESPAFSYDAGTDYIVLDMGANVYETNITQ